MAEQHEATLEDLLSEPIILSVMASDGVRAADIRRLLTRARTREEQALQIAPRNSGRTQRGAVGGVAATI